jgi:hypothetical protein
VQSCAGIITEEIHGGKMKRVVEKTGIDSLSFWLAWRVYALRGPTATFPADGSWVKRV